MYTKFTYWLDKAVLFDCINRLSSRKVYETKKAVCLPLSKNIEIGWVAPEAWSNFKMCKRQLSWYYASEFSGQYLLISATNINQFGLDIVPSTIITKPDFSSMRLPAPENEDIKQLSEQNSFERACPSAFKKIEDMGDANQIRWMRSMGIRGITYKALFAFHCANHANFIEPKYYLGTQENPIPYSIGPTRQVCSECLEYFNIIGGNHRKKLVVPCPGAVLFAGMAANRYYQVETIGCT